MNKEIFNKVKDNNEEIFKILEYLYTFGIDNTEDIDTIYFNKNYKNVKILKTYDEWNKLGYRIHLGQHGIKMFKGNSFKRHFFDISQVYANKGEEKPITRKFLKDPSVLYENSKDTGFSSKYIDGIKDYISNDFNENEKAIIENLVFTGVLEGTNYYENGILTTKERQRELALDSIKNIIKSNFLDNFESFDKIMKETAIVLRKVLTDIFVEGNNKNLVENRVLDKAQNTYYAINSNKSQHQKFSVGGSEYGSKQGYGEVHKREQLGQSRNEKERNGRNAGSNEIGNVENGRQGRDNEQLNNLYNNGEQLSQNSNRLHIPTQLYERNSKNGLGQRDRRYDKDRSVGQENEREQKNEDVDGRNQSRNDKDTLYDNVKEQASDKRDYRGTERRSEQIATEPRTTNQQMENTTNISNELQEDNKSRISGQSKQENRNSGRKISEQISGQELENIFTSEVRNGTRDSENSKTRIDRGNSKRENSSLNKINSVNNNIEGAGDNSLASSFVAKNTNEAFDNSNIITIFDYMNDNEDKEVNTVEENIENATNENDERIKEIPTKQELLNLDYINEKEQNENKFNLKEKFEDNINAIRTLKKIENENRNATKEEQNVLSKYVGWGGLANYCLDEDRASKENLQIIKELLTKDELRAAKESVNSAYYTPDYIVKEIYKKLKNLDLKVVKYLSQVVELVNF